MKEQNIGKLTKHIRNISQFSSKKYSGVASIVLALVEEARSKNIAKKDIKEYFSNRFKDEKIVNLLDAVNNVYIPYPPQLKSSTQKRNFEDTFSAFHLIKKEFFEKK